MTLQPETDSQDRLVRNWIAAGSGIFGTNVIPGDDNKPRPNNLYATVKRMEDVTVGVDDEVYRGGDTDTVDIFTTGWRIARYSVQFYRVGARNAARRARRYPYTPLGREFLIRNNLTFKNATDIIDLNTITSSKIEDRVGLTFEFRYIETDDPQNVGKIDTVNINVRETAETDFEEDIEVDRND